MQLTSHVASVSAIALIACGGLLAQDNAFHQIGGPQAGSSEGFVQPARLSNGTTAPEALMHFALDRAARTLTLTIINSSRPIPGECGPVITDIFFNAPPQITGMTLASQVGSGGAAPQFAFKFDGDLFTKPNANKADGFGHFNCALTLNGITPGIQNPNDPQTASGTHVLAPASFLFSLQGDLTLVEAARFASAFSIVPGGNKPVNGVCKFAGAGPSCDASGFISNFVEDCFVVRAEALGNESWTGPIPNNHAFPTQVGQVRDYFGISASNVLTLPLPVTSGSRKDVGLVSGSSGGNLGLIGEQTVEKRVVDEFYLQVLLWDAPRAGESNVLHVKTYDDGTFSTVERGTTNGITWEGQLYVLPDGRRFVRFPWRS